MIHPQFVVCLCCGCPGEIIPSSLPPSLSSGVLLPGEKLSFPFIFKSPNAGIFMEDWGLLTGPVLLGGREVRIRLRGVAFREDINATRREEIEVCARSVESSDEKATAKAELTTVLFLLVQHMLTHRMAEDTAKRIVNMIVDSVRTPPQSPEPFETTVLVSRMHSEVRHPLTLPVSSQEEDVFVSKNPGLYYHHGVVQQLKTIYDELLRPEVLQNELTPEPSAIKPSEKSGKKVSAQPMVSLAD